MCVNETHECSTNGMHAKEDVWCRTDHIGRQGIVGDRKVKLDRFRQALAILQNNKSKCNHEHTVTLSLTHSLTPPEQS